MSRQPKTKRICKEPTTHTLKTDLKVRSDKAIILTVDEYETIRLIDLLGVSREDCAKRMNIARTTAQAIYNEARLKLAKCLVEGLELRIEGGNVSLCDGTAGCPSCPMADNEIER